jgi:hypothetical protein
VDRSGISTKLVFVVDDIVSCCPYYYTLRGNLLS